MKSAKKGVSVEEWRARRMLLPTLLIISGVGGRLAELADGVLG